MHLKSLAVPICLLYIVSVVMPSKKYYINFAAGMHRHVESVELKCIVIMLKLWTWKQLFILKGSGFTLRVHFLWRNLCLDMVRYSL